LLSSTLLAVLKTHYSGRLLVWIRSLGGVGFIPLGLIDSSVIPIPGSMDAFTIVLAAAQPGWWPYYAFMATLGSVIGGYATYQIARKEGQETLVRKLSRSKMKSVTDIFTKWGFGAVAIPAMIPPPMPIVPFLIAAGAAQYSVKRFLLALSLGRAARYTVLAFLAARYGSKIWTSILHNGPAFLWIGLALLVIACVSVHFYLRGKSHRAAAQATAGK
jgi:membrane protein YqaA with SNARE-associated domain